MYLIRDRSPDRSPIKMQPRSISIATNAPPRNYWRPAYTVSTLLEPDVPYGEDLLQFVWEARLFEQHALRTINGEPVEVIDPGVIQRNSGPDLNGAQIRIGGQLWAGPVEVHLRSSEWNTHGHQFDPAYGNVILHVVYEHDQEVRTLQEKTIPTIELLPRVSTESIALYRSIMTSKRSVPCASQIRSISEQTIDSWLTRSLIARLDRKSLQVVDLHERLGHDPASTFYHLLLQSLGMKVNAEPFGMLAHALPLKLLLKYRDDPIRTEALLFGQAGLLQTDLFDEYPRRIQQEYQVLRHLHGIRSMPMVAWKFGRIRPVNFPTVRLAQLAKLFSSNNAPINDLLSAERINEIRQLLDVEADGYWLDHYQFDRITSPKRKKFGRMAADHVIINAIVPALFAFSKFQGRSVLRDRAIELLEQLPAEKNQVLADWASLGIHARSAGRSQALLELKAVYCNKRRCLSCGVGKELLASTSPSRERIL